jgi:GMC oxidoreductase/FAD binding domain
VQVDARHLPAGAELEADVTIVGAGPAGIVLAVELAHAGHRVTVIESGGNHFDGDVQRLGDIVDGDPLHVPMSLATRRQIGGASNLWAGRCVPFDPIDFQPRRIAGDVRWPVDYEELAAYLSRACDWCVCGDPIFDADRIPGLAERSLVPGWPDGEIRASALERWSLPTNFGERYRATLVASPLITLVRNLTCTEIVCDADGQGVSHLLAKTLTGDCVSVRAARHILACGGVEAVRLLLASTRTHPSGIGNHGGHLGRWYMTHVMLSIAQVHFTTPPEQTIYDFERDPDGVYVRRRLTFAPEFLLAHDLPNTAMYLDNPEIGDPAHGSATLSLIYLMLVSPLGRHLVAEGIRRSQVKTTRPTTVWPHLKNVLSDFATAVRFALKIGYERYLIRGRKAPGAFVASPSNTYSILYHGEHLPHRASRVELTGERDALGVPRLRSRLHFGDADVRGVIEAHEHLDAYLRKHELGYLTYPHDDRERAVRERLFGGYAQIGMTRMSAQPEDGVLDLNLAVHGFDDLFVASSSAFPTSGQANPTLTIVAFALRLADHLDRGLR